MLSNTEDQMNESPMASGTVTSSAPGTQGMESVISAGLRIVGNLESDGDVVIAGTVEGDISSRGLTVAEGATVKGAIDAEMVTILGVVEGEIKARSVGIAKTGEMTGDIEYATLAIEDGAVLEGTCRRIKAGADAKISKLKAVEGGAARPAAAAPAAKPAEEVKPEAS